MLQKNQGENFLRKNFWGAKSVTNLVRVSLGVAVEFKLRVRVKGSKVVEKGTLVIVKVVWLLV